MNELQIIARCALMLAGAVACASASAQAPAANPAAPVSQDSTSAADRAQKQADRTLYWIRVLSEKPAARPAAAAAKPAAPAAVAAQPPARATAAVAADTRQAANVKVASSAPAAAMVTDSGAAGSVVTRVATAATTPAGTAPNATSSIASGGLDAGISMPGVAAALAAPAMTPPETDVAPVETDEPDPGLIMIKSADPEFPMSTMRRLRKGEVEVRFEVGADGQVQVVSVVRSTNPGLNNAALDAVRQWQFKPTPKGHTAVVDLAFNLDS